MPKLVRVKHRETGEAKDVYSVDAAEYAAEEWEIVGDTPVSTPGAVPTTTMGKPIEPKPIIMKGKKSAKAASKE